jgi:hypothetical protein
MVLLRAFCAFCMMAVGISSNARNGIIPVNRLSLSNTRVRAASPWLVLRGGMGEAEITKICDNVNKSTPLGDLSALKSELSNIQQQSSDMDLWLKEQEQKLKSELGPDGNPLSKNELKRRLKALRVEKERSEKKSKSSENHTKDHPDEDDIDPRLYYENRCAQINELRKNGSAYPHRYDVSLSIPSFRAKFENVFEPGEKESEGRIESIAGRIAQKRQQGRLIFFELRGDGERVQVRPHRGNFRHYRPS